jgi:eukaryotic-like serine/threonine-protein kinase
MEENVTIIGGADRSRPSSGISSGFPTDLLEQSATRLRRFALIYAAVFFLAGIFPALLLPVDRQRFFSSPIQWLPSALGILAAIVVAIVVRSRNMALPTAMTIGLVFEVVSSYAIAAAEFADPMQVQMHRGFLGLSWVAVWVMLFTIVVPTSPRRAVIAALLSVTAVPVVIGAVTLTSDAAPHLDPLQFFFGLIFPYLLVVGMAYYGARAVNQLGTEVKRARELGSYRLEEKLGEGGMGEVWRARHRMLARPAAIKLIRPALGTSQSGASAEALQRFEREAQVTATLRSPHTVHLFDFGIATDGAFYYAMELLDGLDADRLIKKFGPVPPERAIHLLRQVCHSLSEAQTRGLVHRDIKPANIFLCRYGEDFDFVKVLDFGIVRATHDSAETRTIDTGEFVVRGTPAFMAPEQALGARTVDGRADIYSVGCLAYWLLTGHSVFSADSTMGHLLHHAHTPPEPPSKRARNAIPKALDQLVVTCLAKDPAGRPQSAKQLSTLLATMPGATAWTQERAREWWGTNLPRERGAARLSDV